MATSPQALVTWPLAERAAPEVVIVGGGPVGLFLGLRLASLGVRFAILERRAQPWPHSRAIGLHPPSLRRLQELGLADRFLDAGVAVRRGRVFGGRRLLGVLDFGATLSGPFPHALSCPQDRTEQLLAEALQRRCPGALLRGWELLQLEALPDRVRLEVQSPLGRGWLETPWLVGADGKNSSVREAAGLGFDGAPYAQTFVMGDLPDQTNFGTDAALYLSRAGLVESFPLPGGLRRWVASTSEYVKEAPGDRLVELVAQRSGHQLSGQPRAMESAFGVQRYLATRFHAGRRLLVGDAAHVLSPIGGQGMNLGWLDAWALGEVLQRVLRQGASPQRELGAWSQTRRRQARRAIGRAASNMRLGIAGRLSPLRDLAVRAALASPLRGALARYFTMEGL